MCYWVYLMIFPPFLLIVVFDNSIYFSLVLRIFVNLFNIPTKRAKNTCSLYLIINLSLLSSGNQGKGCSCPATVSWEISHQWVSLGCSVRDGQRRKISSYTPYFYIFIIKCLRKRLLS